MDETNPFFAPGSWFWNERKIGEGGCSFFFFVGYALGRNNHCFSGYFSELDLDEC